MISATVIMAACATEQRYFSEAVESVLGQTVADFEFIVVDDGLSEENRAYLFGIADERLIVLRNEENIGQSRSVNRALAVARGEFVVRMDADDIMRPERMAIEVAYMRSHPDVIAAGALARRTSDGGIIPRRYPDARSLEMGLIFSCDMIHPTMVFRRERAARTGLAYDEDQLYAQDYCFWVSALERGCIAQIDSVVLDYRIHEGQISKKKTAEQLAYANRTRARMLERMGLSLSPGHLALLSDFVTSCEGDPTRFSVLVRSLRKQASTFSPEDRSLFLRELDARVVKAGARFIRVGRASDAIRWGSFWAALIKVWRWPFYLSVVR